MIAADRGGGQTTEGRGDGSDFKLTRDRQARGSHAFERPDVNGQFLRVVEQRLA